MTDEDIIEIRKLHVSPGNVVLITVRNGIADNGLAKIGRIMDQFSGDSGAMVLIFRERVVSDFQTLGLVELVKLQEVIDKAVSELFQRDVKGDA